jgi:hypothetical protein
MAKPMLRLSDARPDLASELADPEDARVSLGSGAVLLWRCPNHAEPYPQRVSHRVAGVGCPYCAGKRVLPGFNDLATTHPELARELVGTDPRTVTAGSGKVLSWRCPNHSEPYLSKPSDRKRGLGCGLCRGRTLAVGVNDLATTHPDLAEELVGIDPTSVMAKSTKRVPWRCPNHAEPFSMSPRSRVAGKRCPVCTRKVVVPGFNDMATTHPTLSAELVGEDPTTLFASTMRVLLWRCPNHSEPYPSSGSNRVKGQGCGYCSNKRLLPGLNDLATTHPDLARELLDVDPRSLTAGSGSGCMWLCDVHGPYAQQVRKRASGQGCPACAAYGFNPSLPAWVYLAERPGEQQVGITGDLRRRAREHERHGWHLRDHLGPMDGEDALRVETEVKAWLRGAIPLLPGTMERWSTAHLEVISLRHLFAEAQVTVRV